jgi:hypothetical protein
MKNLVLNNGEMAIFLHEDDWGRPVYRLKSGRKVCCVNLSGTYLHGISADCGEPEYPLNEEFQPNEKQL